MALSSIVSCARLGILGSVASLAILPLIAGCKPTAPSSPAQAATASMFPVSASGDTGQPVLFTDPNEHAFSVLAPAGWTVKGGLVRHSSTSAAPWVQEISTDGSSSVFYGDTSLPNFLAPNEQRQQGGVVSTQFGDEPV